MPEQKLRIGIIGMGLYAALEHVPSLRATGRAEVVAAARRDPARLALAQRELGIAEVHTDWREMLAQASLDAGVVSTPHNLYAIQAWEANMETEIVRHVLLVSFKDGATEIQIQNFFSVFRQMASKVDGVISFEDGVNNSSEGLTRGFTHVVMITFTNAQARDAYLPHPEHQKFGEWLGQLNILKELLVIDYIPQK